MSKKKDEITIHSAAAEYLTYVAAVGDSADSMEMRYENENIWLTQKMMAVLYDVDVRTVNEHIKKIYSDGELTEEATIRKFRIVQAEGSRQVKREVIHYNLQMIIAVGFKGICSQMNTLSASYRISVRFAFQNANSIRKSLTCMLQPSTMIKMQRLPDVSSKQCRIRCTGQFIGIQQQS